MSDATQVNATVEVGQESQRQTIKKIDVTTYETIKVH